MDWTQVSLAIGKHSNHHTNGIKVVYTINIVIIIAIVIKHLIMLLYAGLTDYYTGSILTWCSILLGLCQTLAMLFKSTLP